METVLSDIPKRACCVCGNTKKVAKHRKSGNLYCENCKNNDESTWEICSTCGENKPVVKWLDDGTAQCGKCYIKKYKEAKRKQKNKKLK